MEINNYKFEKISSVMGNEFGKIRKGDEEEHTHLLFAMESNLLKLYRFNDKRDDYSAIKAIKICLFTIDGYLNDIKYNLDKFLDDNNKDFVNGLLWVFDPFVNEVIKDSICENIDLNNKSDLRKYFENPVKCLLRIEKSIELWTKEFGPVGYFKFLEDQVGNAIAHDDTMDYLVELGM